MKSIEFHQLGGKVTVQSRGGLTNLPYNTAITCTLRKSEQEWGGTSTAIHAGGSFQSIFFGEFDFSSFPAGLDTIDLVFRPSTQMGSKAFDSDDIVFSREFAVENVPVEWIESDE